MTARDFVISQQSAFTWLMRNADADDFITLPCKISSRPPLGRLPRQLLHFRRKTALAKVLPPVKRVNVLEEAEFVEVDGGFEKEKMLQCESPESVSELAILAC